MLHTAKSIVRRGGVWLAVASFLTVPVAIAGTTVLASSPAGAAFTGGCQFAGQTNGLSPIPAIPTTFTAGTFGFTGPATCVDSGGNVTNGIITVPSTGTGHGTYSNTICGTGTADGTATFSGGINLLPITFHINFVAGVGALTVLSHTGGSGATGAGVVQIAPEPNPTDSGHPITLGCLPGTPVVNFTVTGAFAGTQPAVPGI